MEVKLSKQQKVTVKSSEDIYLVRHQNRKPPDKNEKRKCSMRRAAYQDAERRQTSIAPVHGDNGCC